MESFARFDALAWGFAVGSLLMLAGLVWVLVENRPINDHLRAGSVPTDPAEKPPTTRRAA